MGVSIYHFPSEKNNQILKEEHIFTKIYAGKYAFGYKEEKYFLDKASKTQTLQNMEKLQNIAKY